MNKGSGDHGYATTETRVPLELSRRGSGRSGELCGRVGFHSKVGKIAIQEGIRRQGGLQTCGQELSEHLR